MTLSRGFEILPNMQGNYRETETVTRTRVTEAEAERAIDRLVWRRLAVDPAYCYAEDADSQSLREEEITRECERDYYAAHDVIG